MPKKNEVKKETKPKADSEHPQVERDKRDAAFKKSLGE